MFKKLAFSWMIVTFILGLLIGTFYPVNAVETPFSLGENKVTANVMMPKDRIHESQIKVYSDKVIIQIDNPEWSKFADTNSMIPFLDEGANALQIVPENEDEIQIGDIISYKSNKVSGTIIHRVVEIGTDSEGKYFLAKGDNNPSIDPEFIRFEQIKRVLVGIIY